MKNYIFPLPCLETPEAWEPPEEGERGWDGVCWGVGEEGKMRELGLTCK